MTFVSYTILWICIKVGLTVWAETICDLIPSMGQYDLHFMVGSNLSQYLWQLNFGTEYQCNIGIQYCKNEKKNLQHGFVAVTYFLFKRVIFFKT